MARDKDEWRRPWADGQDGLPAGLPRSVAGHGSEDVAASSTTTGYLASDLFSTDPFLAAAPALSATSAALAGEPTASVAPARPATPVRGRRGGFVGGIAGGILGAFLVLGLLASLDVVDLSLPTGTATGQVTSSGAADGRVSAPAPSSGSPLATDPSASLIPDMAERVLPTVVRINVSGSASLTEANALGSGVIYRSDGYIITNHHVIEGAAAVEVLLADGDRLEAEIVGSDQLNDLAVLRIARDGLPVIDLRPDDQRLRVGESVVAIGSPFGLDATVTSGIISALNRDLRVPGSSDVIPAVIQTDAAINPGNSGGALVDLQGRLVGINTAIMSRSGANQGVGFAVAVQQAVTSADQLIAQGFVRYPLLGITGTDVSAAVAEAYRLDNRRGAVVASVASESSAAEAGMRTGDLIVAVDGIPLRSMSDLVAEVRRRAPGQAVTFDVLRGTERLRIDVVLGERPRG